MPEVRRGIVMPVGHGSLQLKDRYQLGLSLRQEQYTRSITLPNSLKSALVPLFSKIPLRTGWRGEMRYGLLNDLRMLDKKAIPLMVERFTALAFDESNPAAQGGTILKDIPKPKLVIDNSNINPLLTKHGLDQSTPILVLCPGAEFGSSKRWPDTYYASIAAEKIQAGWQVWIFGSENDYAVAERIRDQLAESDQPQCQLLAGKTALSEAVDLMSLADAVVSNDSGLMHIAAALNLPLVVVYGSTSPSFTPPLSDSVKILSASIHCSPCFERECPKLGIEKDQCMKELAPGHVIAAIDELLSTGIQKEEAIR